MALVREGYALVRNGEVVRAAFTLNATDETAAGLGWLPRYIDRPTIADPVAQGLTGPVITITATQVNYVWTAVERTAAEQDAFKDGLLAQPMLGAALKGLFNHENRVRALEGKAAITAAQFKTAVKALL